MIDHGAAVWRRLLGTVAAYCVRKTIEDKKTSLARANIFRAVLAARVFVYKRHTHGAYPPRITDTNNARVCRPGFVRTFRH